MLITEFFGHVKSIFQFLQLILVLVIVTAGRWRTLVVAVMVLMTVVLMFSVRTLIPHALVVLPEKFFTIAIAIMTFESLPFLHSLVKSFILVLAVVAVMVLFRLPILVRSFSSMRVEHIFS